MAYCSVRIYRLHILRLFFVWLAMGMLFLKTALVCPYLAILVYLYRSLLMSVRLSKPWVQFLCCIKPVSICCSVTWPIVGVRRSIGCIFIPTGFLGKGSDAPPRKPSSSDRPNVIAYFIVNHFVPNSPALYVQEDLTSSPKIGYVSGSG